jgi:hypothetical protein
MRKQLRVAYLSYDGLTDPLGQSQILSYVIGLSKKGYLFTIISFEKPERYKQLGDEIKSICRAHDIEWLPKKYHKNPQIFSTLFDLLILWFTLSKRQRHNPFDIIHCRSYIASLVGLQAKRKLGVKFIFDMRGFWADERAEVGIWNLRNPVKRADYIISLSFSAKKEIENWRIAHAPIAVIPTCVDLDLFNPSKIRLDDQLLLRKKLGIDEKDFLLLYLGSWGTWYLTNEMLDFFSKVREKKANAKFLIVSTDEVNLGSYKFRNDIIIRSAKRFEVPLYVSLANAALCFIKPSFSKKASSATKIGEFLAMGLDVISNAGWGDIELLQSDGVRIIHEFSDESLAASVDDLLREKKKNRLPFSQSHPLSLIHGVCSYQRVYEVI